jgi:hypothetical protein
MIYVKPFARALLPSLIATLLTGNAVAQQDECEEMEGTPPGLHFPDQGRGHRRDGSGRVGLR